jgi:predicted DNA-binding transcriptional regulator YafY
MKAERLLAITMLFLNRDSVSAPELARRFEVSVRTIYRDIDALCEAGIPITAYPGAGGGYGIMGDFKIDRSLLKPEEFGQLGAALGSLSSAFGDKGMGQAAERLKAIAPKGRVAGRPVPENYLFIELEPARRDRGKMGILRRAIEERRLVGFGYIDSEGRTSVRSVEPHAIVFTWQAWFLYAYCRRREDFRMFKIARIADPELQCGHFSPRPVDLDSKPWGKEWDSRPPLPAVIRFAEASRIEERFEPGEIEREEGGSALVRTRYPVEEWTVSYLLGLGLAFEVLEPEGLRRLVAERAAGILQKNS